MARVITAKRIARSRVLRLGPNGRVWAPPSIVDLLRQASFEEGKDKAVIIREAMEWWFGADWQPPANNWVPATREVLSAMKARLDPRMGKVIRHYRDERRQEERQRLEGEFSAS